MKSEHVNPFIISVCKIMKDMCMLDLKLGNPMIRNGKYDAENSLIKLGLDGNLSGEVVLNLNHATALELVSRMVMMPVEAIDELGQSAISELGNMIAGNAATIFAGNSIMIDITPPSYCLGSEYADDGKELFSIPFSSEIGDLSVDVFIQ